MLTKKFNVTRNLPKNFKKVDADVFNHELNRTFNSILINKKKNVFINDNKFYLFRYFQFGSRFWRMVEFNRKQKFKVFIKNLYFLTKKKLINEEIIPLKEASWVINEKSHNYFHWYCDVFQRIEYLISTNHSKKKKIKPILLTENYINKHYVQTLLKDFDIPHIYLEKNKIYKIKELDITTHAAPSGNYDPRIITKVSEKLKTEYLMSEKFDNSNDYKRLWISRKLAGKRRIKNLKEISQILENFKFKIVDFEDMTTREQVNLVNESDVLAGVHGAGLTNMMFLDKGKSIIEVRGNGDKSNNCFFSLASELSLNYYYFFAEVDENDFYGSDYYINADNLNKFLQSFFRESHD